MARPKKENTRKSIFGAKLETLVANKKNTRLGEYFKVGMTALSKYLNGDSTPSMEKLQEFVLNYAAAHDMQMIDLNWLMNDNDRRLGPVFVANSKESAPNPVEAPPETVYADDHEAEETSSTLGLDEEIALCLENATFIHQHLGEAQRAVLRGELSAKEFLRLSDSLLSEIGSAIDVRRKRRQSSDTEDHNAGA